MQVESLEPWVNASHFAKDSIDSYSARFQQNDIRLLTINNFLMSSTLEKCSRFLCDHAHYETMYGVFAKKQKTTDKLSWSALPEAERFFCYEMLSGSDHSDTINSDSLAFLKLRHFLGSMIFRQYVSRLTAMRLAEVTPIKVHRMYRGHFLKPHDDRSDGRLIAFILYLSPSWLPEYGGSLRIIKHGGSEVVVEPFFNRLLIFDVNRHKHHYIAEIFEQGRIARRNGRISINGWFF